MAAAVFRIKGQSHTCIRVSDGPKFVLYVPMSTLQLEKAEARDFYTEWEEFATYPVRRAAELYLGATQYREMSPKAREHLEAIVANPATVFDPARIFPQPEPSKELTMSKTPATSKLAATSKASTAPAKTKVAGKTEAADTKAAGKKPAKAAPNGMDTVVKQATAAGAAAKKAPAKQAAPAKTAAPVKGAAKTAAPAKQAAPAPKAAPVPRTSPNADQKLKVAEPDKPRRGVTQDFVNEAIKLKTFTRQQLHDVMVKKGHDSKAARIKIADCVYFQVFVEA